MGIRRLSTVVAVGLIGGVGMPLVSAAKGHQGSGHGGVASGRSHCDVDTCAVATALEDACPCEDATNHGQYVRCVAHATKALAADATIARRCRGRVVRLAARSVCGRPNTVTCLVPTSSCADDGTCVNDPNTDCGVDTDCGTQCETTTPDDCDAANGLASPAGSCASADCFSPSGAFLE
jgi:hypothetical protein